MRLETWLLTALELVGDNNEDSLISRTNLKLPGLLMLSEAPW
jgi:hypothetical protein